MLLGGQGLGDGGGAAGSLVAGIVTGSQWSLRASPKWARQSCLERERRKERKPERGGVEGLTRRRVPLPLA